MARPSREEFFWRLPLLFYDKKITLENLDPGFEFFFLTDPTLRQGVERVNCFKNKNNIMA